MSIGTSYTVRMHVDATNNIVLDDISVGSFNHGGSFGASAVTSIKINDRSGNYEFDAYDVQIDYPEGFAPAPNTLTVNQLVQAAFAAVNASPRIGGSDQLPAIRTLGTIVPGAGYVPGTYAYVKLHGGTGNGAAASIVVNADGTVHAGGVTLVANGEGYTALDVLTARAGDMGGVTLVGRVPVETGSGFSVPAATVGSIVTNTTYI